MEMVSGSVNQQTQWWCEIRKVLVNPFEMLMSGSVTPYAAWVVLSAIKIVFAIELHQTSKLYDYEAVNSKWNTVAVQLYEPILFIRLPRPILQVHLIPKLQLTGCIDDQYCTFQRFKAIFITSIAPITNGRNTYELNINCAEVQRLWISAKMLRSREGGSSAGKVVGLLSENIICRFWTTFNYKLFHNSSCYNHQTATWRRRRIKWAPKLGPLSINGKVAI